MQRMTGIARDDNGRPVSGASVAVYSTNTTTLANLYSPSAASDTPTTGINNPIVTGSDGVYSFAVDDGDYDISISGSNITTQNLPRVNFFDSTTAGIPGTAVSSVGLSMPVQFSVASSPLIAPGTLTVSWATQTANYVLAGPTTGAAAAPTFRALVAADVNGVAVDLTTAQASIAGAKTFTSALTASAGISTTTMTASGAVAGTTGTFSSTIGAATVTRFTAYANSSPTNGDVWLNSTTKGLSYYNTTTSHAVSSCLINQVAAVSYNTSTTETTLLASAYTLQANYLTAGKTLRIRAFGTIGNTGTPTLTLKVKLGGATVCSTGAVTMSTITGSMLFALEADVVIRTAGGSGTAIGYISGQYQTAYNAALLSMSAPTSSTTTIDTTANSSFDITAQWSASSASNAIVITGLTVESLG
jgi:hypothetical protein